MFEGEQISFDRFSKIRFQLNNPTHNPNNANQSDLLDDYLVADLHEDISDSKYFDGESFNNLDVRKSLSILSCSINSFPKNFDAFQSNYLNYSKFKPEVLQNSPHPRLSGHWPQLRKCVVGNH